MSRQTSTVMILAAGVLAAVLIAANQDELVPHAFQSSSQQWKLKDSDTPGMVRFTIERRKPGSRWSNTNDVRMANFRGLSRETMERGGRVKFQYVHDAGTLNCEGAFSWNGGSGTFTFEGSSTFRSELRRLGYQPPDDEQLFNMMMGNVTLEFARQAREAGLNPSTRQLIELRNHGVSADYIHDTIKAGYRDLAAQDFIDLKNHGVSTWFLRDLKDSGYDLRTREVIELRNHGVSSEFLSDLKHAGYDLNAVQVVELSNHGVGSQFLRELKQFGLQPSAADIVQLRNHGVSPNYLKGLKDAGYGKLAVDEIIALTSHGVSIDFAREAREAGYDFTTSELVSLHDHGVSGKYLRHLRETGMKNLTAAQIQKLRDHGVE